MRRALVLLTLLATLPAAAAPREPQVVNIPYMEREAPHRAYADELLALAMELSRDKYGPYRIVQQSKETVIRRQLVELDTGGSLSVAVAVPTPEWLEGAVPVRVPIERGLASFRFFFGLQSDRALHASVKTVADLRDLTIGQGPGWSTVGILQDNGFKIALGGPHPTLIPMLASRRFQLLMRSVYELEPELEAHKARYPDLRIVDDFAVFTYMPLYFFVSKGQPELAERLTYGLKKAHANGQMDKLFNRRFGGSLKLLRNPKLKLLQVTNTNLDKRFFERDRPWLLPSVVAAQRQAPGR